MVAADCTGHGVSGALMSMLGMSLLNQIVNGHGITQPSLILDQLHSAVVDALKQSENNSREGMDIAICRFDAQRKTVQYSGANRPLWIIRNGELIISPADKMPVGDFQLDTRTPFTNHIIPLQSGDRIFMFTDGFADQFGGMLGKKLMTKKIKEFLVQFSAIPMNQLGEKLQSYFNNWKGDQEQVDDVLFLGLKTAD
ncbi:MAG: SpoIIE family protein phosphatase [Bacteroidetes bacterium]|nr:SpoIIE family protein phosphatase [Bacteroidota bacterium]